MEFARYLITNLPRDTLLSMQISDMQEAKKIGGKRADSQHQDAGNEP